MNTSTPLGINEKGDKGFGKKEPNKNLGCPHGRPAGQICPHCSGINEIVKPKDICGCSGPYTCKYHMGEFDYCDNNHCLCHKSYGDRIMNHAEKAYRRTHNQIIENQKSMNNQPIFQPNEKSWAERFDEKFARFTQLEIDMQSSTLPDFTIEEKAENHCKQIAMRQHNSKLELIKSFISTLLQEQKAKILELIEGERIGRNGDTYNQPSSPDSIGFNSALDTIKKRIEEI